MKWFVVAACLLMVGCGAWWIKDTYDPQFDIPATEAMTPYEVCRWVYWRVEYLDDWIHDKAEYWQSPDQTYEWGRGDCEDYAILVIYLIHRDLGGWPQLVLGDYYDGASGGGHGWVEYEGRWYESETGRDVTDDTRYTLYRTIAYGEALWRSMNWHRSVE